MLAQTTGALNMPKRSAKDLWNDLKGLIPRAIEDLLTAARELNKNRLCVKLYARFGYLGKRQLHLPVKLEY